MSFYSPALHHRRAPKLCLKQQQSSLPLFRTTSSTKSHTTSSTYTRSSSVKKPTSSCSSTSKAIPFPLDWYLQQIGIVADVEFLETLKMDLSQLQSTESSASYTFHKKGHIPQTP